MTLRQTILLVIGLTLLAAALLALGPHGPVGQAISPNPRSAAFNASLLAEVRLFTGSFGDWGGRASTSVSSRSGSRRALWLVHGRRADNDYAYLDHNQTFQTSVDDTMRRRANAQCAEYGWYGLGELDGGLATVRLSGGFYRQDGGRPGPLGFPSPHAAIRRERWDLRLGAADPQRRATLDVAVSRRRDWLHDDDAEGRIAPT